MSRRLLVLLVCASVPLALLCASFTASCSREESAALPPPAVRTALLHSESPASLVLRGSVVAGSRLRLSFKVGGVLADVLCREGQQVHKGQVLARLSSTDPQSQVNASQAAADKAQRDADVASRLFDRGALAEKLRDDARTQLQVATASLAQAREALWRTQLLAPVSGTIFQRTAEPGEAVGPGVPVLILDETERPLIKVGVTEHDLDMLAVDQPVRFMQEEGLDRAGRILSLSPTPDPADGLYTVQIMPAEANREALRPGTLVQVKFQGLLRPAVLRVPIEALVHRQDQDGVFVVGPDQVARLRPVTLGRCEGKRVIVKAGLSGDERLITEGAVFLNDGQAVRSLD